MLLNCIISTMQFAALSQQTCVQLFFTPLLCIYFCLTPAMYPVSYLYSLLVRCHDDTGSAATVG